MKKLSFYIQHTESGIYKCLLHMGFYQGEFLNRGKPPIDEITTSHLEHAVKQLDFAPKEIYVKKPCDVNTSTKELMGFFHIDLWNQQKNSRALTCFESCLSAG